MPRLSEKSTERPDSRDEALAGCAKFAEFRPRLLEQLRQVDSATRDGMSQRVCSRRTHESFQATVRKHGAGWYTWPSSLTTNAVVMPINPANPAVVPRLVYPLLSLRGCLDRLADTRNAVPVHGRGPTALPTPMSAGMPYSQQPAHGCFIGVSPRFIKTVAIRPVQPV